MLRHFRVSLYCADENALFCVMATKIQRFFVSNRNNIEVLL
jgi:hypothetical protein